VKVSRADRAIRPLLLACYPDWKGRKVSVCVAESYQMMDYWSEGSRHYVRAFDIATGKIADHDASNPFRGQAHARVTIPDGIALVEHSIFCGKDAGIAIYVTPASLARLLPGNASARS